MVILGIDPALNRVGYGILFSDNENGNIVDCKYGVYDISPRDSTEDKLYKSFKTTQYLIQKYNVDEVVIEKAFHNPRRARGGMVVREVIGAIKVAVKQTGRPIYMYSPQTVKKIVTGSGLAKKHDVAYGIASILNISKFKIEMRYRGEIKKFFYSPEDLVDKGLDHISDALSISYCRLREVQKNNGRVAKNAV
jgi:crossover junction endodeoxyribonuclease RuvC